MIKGIFVTATDTGVGKTTVAGALAGSLRARGVDVGVFKPVETGALAGDDGLYGQDAQALARMAGCSDPAGMINPCLFKKPLSPYHSASAEGADVDTRMILDVFKTLSARHEFMIVEGAGGLLVPLDGSLFIGDLARMIGLPALIVSHPFLGCINHTLMTAGTAQSMGVDILGVVFNQWKNESYPAPDFGFMQEKTGAPVFGLLPYIEEPGDGELLKTFCERVDVDAIAEGVDGRFRDANRRRASYEERDKKYVWHPFTQMKDWLNEPVTVIESGSGLILKDVTGAQYLDGHSSYWCNAHGHANRRLAGAVRRQLDKISHSTFLGLSNAPAVDLAEKLAEITPEGLCKVFYSDDGSTAVEAALKMSYQYWRHVEGKDSERSAFLCVKNAYHGDTIGAVSVGGIDQYHTTFRDMLFNTISVPSPYCYRCPLGKTHPDCALACAGMVDDALKANRGKVAAMIVEPLVQCPAGIITAPHGYLEMVREFCRKHDVLFIADEVAVGFGRTGRMFACDNEGVRPDIMTLSKTITGGTLPFAATMTTEKVFDAFLGDYEEEKTFFHGHTYTGNQLGCCVAIENIRMIEERGMVKAVREKSAQLRGMLSRFNGLEHVGDIRIRGLIAGIELVKDKGAKEPYHWHERIGVKTVMEAKRRGLIVRPLGNVIVMFPALSVTQKQLERMTGIVYDSIAAVTGAPA